MSEFKTHYGGEQDYYDEEAGDFGTQHVAKVLVEEKSEVNEVGKVVDLLNEFSGDEIREEMLGDSDD